METCYKVFRKSVIENVEIQENRFGFEPEIVAKVSQMRLRIFEMGISYYGRTYADGKKIGAKDGFRALYCIFRYNAHKAPLPIQFFLYLNIGAIAAILNLILFSSFLGLDISVQYAAPISFVIAAAANYILCISILFRHRVRWKAKTEILIYILIVAVGCIFDLIFTKFFISIGISPILSKVVATIIVFLLNFLGRRFIVFPEPSVGPWPPSDEPPKS
jgi:putative flippase GtrA